MPRKVIDYSKTVIYKIVCKDLEIKDEYVGHTTDFDKRKSQHKTSSMSTKKYTGSARVYEFIRKNGGWENWTMIEIEKFPCKDSNEAKARERHWIETRKANLNMSIPIRGATERVECECGVKHSVHNRYHKRSQQHQKWLQKDK
jgi:predicted GIY-YIG superfamily endonuclease